ncbi:MAG: hypothetical protein AB7I13_03665 [Vicinamibacterales bacterium]
MTRATLLLAVTTVLVVTPAARAQTDITGTWMVTIDSPLGQASIETVFTQQGEKVTGHVDGPDGKPLEFTGTLIKDQLSALYPLPLQGQSLPVRLTGTAESGRMSGQVDFGGVAQATWSARRKPASETALAPLPPSAADLTTVSGTWNMVIRLGAVSLPLTGTLVQSGDAVSGLIRTPVGDAPATGTMANGHLVLQFTAQLPQGAVPVTLTGDLTAQGLSGTSSAVGLGRSEWSATRAE